MTVGNAQAGPSRRRPLGPIIDLTLSDDEEPVARPAPTATSERNTKPSGVKTEVEPAGASRGKRAQSVTTIVSTIDSDIMEVSTDGRHTGAGVMMGKGKGKAVDRGLTSVHGKGGSSRRDIDADGGHGGSRIKNNRDAGTGTRTSDNDFIKVPPPQRAPIHPPWEQPRRPMQRQPSMAPRRAHHSTSRSTSPVKHKPDREIAGSARVASQQPKQSIPAASSRVGLPEPHMSARAAPVASSSRLVDRQRPHPVPRTSSHTDIAGLPSSQSTKGKSADRNPTTQSSLSDWQKGLRRMQKASAPAPVSDTLSSRDEDHDRYRKTIKRPSIPSSQPTNHVEQPRKSTPLPNVKKASSSTPKVEDGKLMKRTGSGFGSHGKPIRSPHEKPIGRLSGPHGFAMKRTNSSQSTVSGATPTPAARTVYVIPTDRHSSSNSKSTDRRSRPTSPLKQSSTTIAQGAAESEDEETDQTRASTPASTPPKADPSRSRSAQQNAKPTRPNHSPDYQAKSAKLLAGPSQKTRKEPSTASNTITAKPVRTTDPASRQRTRSASIQAPREEDTTSRPKRARPAAGAYTVPSMDAVKWPENRAHMPEASQPRRKRKAEGMDTPKQGQATEPTQARQVSRRRDSVAPSVASSSTHVSSGSRPPRMGPPVVTPSRSSRTSIGQSDHSGGVRKTATPVRPGVLSPYQPNYRIPTPSTVKRGRLNTQTPTHSTPRHKEVRPVTPSPRRTRPATLTPKTQQDGPDEEEEPVEDEDFDPLAAFADYQFAPMSPAQSMVGVRESDSGTPSNADTTVAPTTPVSAAKETAESPSVRHSGSKADRPASHSEVASVAGSPRGVRLFGSGATINLAANILARTKAAAAKALEEQERRAAKRAEMESEKPEEGLQKLQTLDLAAAITISASEPPAVEEEPQISRRSSRIRSTSIGQGAKVSSSRPKPTVKETIKPRRPPTAGDTFFKEYRANAKNGYETGFAELALQSISRSVSPNKGGAAEYPTPDPDDSLESRSHKGREGEAELLDTTMDMLENDSEMDGLLDVARELKDSRKNSARPSVVEETPVFWDTPHEPATATASAMGENPDITGLGFLLGLASSLPSGLLPVLAAAWSLPVSAHPSSGPIGPRLTYAAMAEFDSAKRSIIQTRLLRTIETAIENPFHTSERLHDCICVTWRSLGAVLGLSLPIDDKSEGPAIAIGREEACSFICQIIIASIKRDWLSPFLSRVPAISLVFLAIDPSTSAPLRRTLDDTIAALWVHCLSVGGSSRSEADEVQYRNSKSKDLARSLLDLAESMSLPMSVKTRIILAIGHKNVESRSIARWYATGLLLSGGSQTIDRANEHRTPSIDLLMEGAELLRAAILTPSPIYDHVNDLITCIYTSLSDIEKLVQITPYLSDDPALHPITDLRALIKSLSDGMRVPGSYELRSLVSRMKGRLGQLVVVLEMQFDTAFKRMKSEKERAKLGPGLRQGKNGQSTLAFSRDTTVSMDTGA